MRIYLCGGIKKTDDEKKIVWTQEDKDKLLRTVPGVSLLDPQKTPELDDPMIAFGCDLNDINSADLVLVDMRQKRGIGIGAEMAIAKFLKKPVVSVCPRNSHFRRDELVHRGRSVNGWVHPFMFGLSDFVAEDVEDAARWISDFMENPKGIKDGSVVQEAISYFQKSGKERI